MRRSAVMLFSGSTAYTSSPTTLSMGSQCSKTFSFWLADINNNPMPAGTKVTLENEAITYTKDYGSGIISTFSTTNSVGGTPISDSSNTGGTLVSLTVDGVIDVGFCNGTGTTPYPKGTVNMVISTPNNVKTYIPITVN